MVRLTRFIPHEDLTPLQAAVGVVKKGLRPTIPENIDPTLGESTLLESRPNKKARFLRNHGRAGGRPETCLQTNSKFPVQNLSIFENFLCSFPFEWLVSNTTIYTNHPIL